MTEPLQFEDALTPVHSLPWAAAAIITERMQGHLLAGWSLFIPVDEHATPPRKVPLELVCDAGSAALGWLDFGEQRCGLRDYDSLCAEMQRVVQGPVTLPVSEYVSFLSRVATAVAEYRLSVQRLRG